MYPYFPRPLLSEFEFRVPVSQPPKNTDVNEGEDGEGGESNEQAAMRLEESFVRASILLSLLSDQTTSGQRDREKQTFLARQELEHDKLLLQLLAVECRAGEERGMKALEIVGLLRDRSGRTVEAAQKVAGRWGHGVLEARIREVAEGRLGGDGERDEGEDEM